MAQIGSPEEARRIVNYWADEGVTWFKAYTDISREALGAAIEAAHARGLKFTGHLCSVSFREAVRTRHRQPRARPLHQQRLRAEPHAGSLPAGHARQPAARWRSTGPRCSRRFARWSTNKVAMSSTLAVYELSYPDRPPLEDRVLEALAPEAREEYLSDAQGDVGAGRAVDDAGAVPAGAGVRARVREGRRPARRGRRSHRHGRRAAGLRRSAQLRAADRSRLHAGRGDSDHDAQRREGPAASTSELGLDRRPASSPIWSSSAATRSRRPARSATSRSCSRTASATTRRSCSRR